MHTAQAAPLRAAVLVRVALAARARPAFQSPENFLGELAVRIAALQSSQTTIALRSRLELWRIQCESPQFFVETGAT